MVAHVGVNRALISGFEGRKLGDLLEIPQGYGQVYRKTDFIFDAMIVAAGCPPAWGVQAADGDQGKNGDPAQVETLRAGGAREIAVITGSGPGRSGGSVRAGRLVPSQ